MPEIRAERKQGLLRMRLYLVTGEQGGLDETVRIVRAALNGGVDLVQLRKKQLDRANLIQIGRTLRSVAHDFGALFIVNDDPQAALECDADGLHLGQEDGAIETVRRLRGFEDRLIGRSTHSLDQALRAQSEAADYLGVGPVFATPTKPGRPAVGTSLLRDVSSSVQVPFVAIGGIDLSNVGEVLAAGARGVAVVRAIYDAADPEAAARGIRQQVEAGMEARVA
jgi:thiamine-phosphate pyrophosphorylase